jgi:hypothetical protein
MFLKGFLVLTALSACLQRAQAQPKVFIGIDFTGKSIMAFTLTKHPPSVNVEELMHL